MKKYVYFDDENATSYYGDSIEDIEKNCNKSLVETKSTHHNATILVEADFAEEYTAWELLQLEEEQ